MLIGIPEPGEVKTGHPLATRSRIPATAGNSLTKRGNLSELTEPPLSIGWLVNGSWSSLKFVWDRKLPHQVSEAGFGSFAVRATRAMSATPGFYSGVATDRKGP